MKKFLAIAISLAMTALMGCDLAPVSEALSVTSEVLTVAEDSLSSFVPISGETPEEIVTEFMQDSGDIAPSDSITRIERRPVGDGLSSYSIYMETAEGESVYIDNALVLPDNCEYIMYDEATGNVSYEYEWEGAEALPEYPIEHSKNSEPVGGLDDPRPMDFSPF